MASMLKGRAVWTVRKALRSRSMAAGVARMGRRRSVTTVKKYEPPGMKARRYFMGGP